MLPAFTPAPRPGAPAYAVYLWSDGAARWKPLCFSQSVEPCEQWRNQLVSILGPIPVLIASIPAYDPEASEAGSFTLAPAAGGFEDPAPDGIILPPSHFDDIVFAVSLEAQFQSWCEDVFTFNPGLTFDLVLRDMFMDQRRGPMELPAFNG